MKSEINANLLKIFKILYSPQLAWELK